MNLPIRIIHMVSGEHVIAKIQHMTTDDKTTDCFNFIMPMSLIVLEPSTPEEKPKTKFYPYSPFSSDPEFKVGYDKVTTIGKPVPEVLDTYIDIVQQTYPVLDEETFNEYMKERLARNQK